MNRKILSGWLALVGILSLHPAFGFCQLSNRAKTLSDCLQLNLQGENTQLASGFKNAPSLAWRVPKSFPDKREIISLMPTGSGVKELKVAKDRDNPRKAFRPRWGLGLKYTFYPSKLEPSPTYIAASGRVPPVIDNLGYRVLVAFIPACLERQKGVEGWIEFSSGYIKIGPRQGWNIINADMLVRLEMMPERLFLEVFRVELGMSIIGGRLEWARPPGAYKDKLNKDSGLTETNNIYHLAFSTGCAFYVTRSVSLSANIGGIFFMIWSSFKDADAPWDEKEGYEIDSKWLEYDLGGVGGLELQSAIKIWF